MELAISKLTARRVIYYFEGYVKGERPKGLKFVFYNYDLKITIKPSVFETAVFPVPCSINKAKKGFARALLTPSF